VKVNDQGTSDTSDDRVVGGSTFEFRLDDGDGTYEPDGADAPVLATVSAPHGFAVFNPPAPGSYWVIESIAPAGLDVAPPQLVTWGVPATPQNCVVLRSGGTCIADEDGSGGFEMVVVTDSPTGEVLASQQALPATDAGPGVETAGSATGSATWMSVIVIATAVGLLAMTIGRRRRG